MKKEDIDYIVKYKKENFNIKTDINNAKENNKNNNNVLFIICIISIILVFILPIFFFISTNGLKINLLGFIIFIAIILGTPLGLWIGFTAKKRQDEEYVWEIEVKNSKIYVKKANYRYEIDFKNIINIKDEKILVNSSESSTLSVEGIKWRIVLEYLSEKNNINTVRLPYKMKYTHLLTNDLNYILDENQIKKLLDIFVTKKQYEENSETYDSNEYVDIRNSEEEEIFKNNLINGIKKERKKGDIKAIIALIPIIIVIVLSVIIRGGK